MKENRGKCQKSVKRMDGGKTEGHHKTGKKANEQKTAKGIIPLAKEESLTSRPFHVLPP